MIERYSSRREKLSDFLNKKLSGAVSYDRIAGYFCSSILDVAGEAIGQVKGPVRIVCNSGLSIEDVATAKASDMAMKNAWTSEMPEEKYGDEKGKTRLSLLYDLLTSGKLQVKVIPDEVFGLLHGKAGVIRYENNTATSFLGSANETGSGFGHNYELVWEDSSDEAVKWVQEEFNFLWNNPHAIPLSEVVIQDIARITMREIVPLHKWKESPDVSQVAVEEPIFRKEFGLWEHQKYFIELAFKKHMTDGGARLLLADQVGLGKTVQLAMSAKLMALKGDKPILIIVPKTLMWQWQDEMMTLLDLPSAVWTGSFWQDENGHAYRSMDENAILRCPRRVGIISQGLVTRTTAASEKLKTRTYDCIIIDEAHKARRRNAAKNADTNKAQPNNLLSFMFQISQKTHSMLLATATPVQLHRIEVYDLLHVLGTTSEEVLGSEHSEWNRHPETMLQMICGDVPLPNTEARMWDIMRDPFPVSENNNRLIQVRNALHLNDQGKTQFVLSPETYSKATPPTQDKIKRLFTSGKFVEQENPYIRCIVRRTRDELEQARDKDGNPVMKKINVHLLGEDDLSAIPLAGPPKQAYDLAQQFCESLGKRSGGNGFIESMMLRRIGSTLIAGYNTARKMMQWTAEGQQVLLEDFGFDEDELEDVSTDEVSELRNLTSEEVNILKTLAIHLENNVDQDPKYDKVLELLKTGADQTDETGLIVRTKPWSEVGCIIFSQYYDSANFIAGKLSKDMGDKEIGIYAGGDRSGIWLEGKFQKCSREEIKARVKAHELKILVGTDAASEGLNLQTLQTLINIDLPWNPTRLEQRKGRIQRIGQISDDIYIYNLRYKDSVEDRVHTRLSERLKSIYDLFGGQLPDTLETVWIQVALGQQAAAEQRIDETQRINPFVVKYNKTVCGEDSEDDWSQCALVLDKDDALQQLLKGW